MNRNSNGIKLNNGKSVAKGLFIVMTILFLIMAIILYYIAQDTTELECVYEQEKNGIKYQFTKKYLFKNYILREEKIDLWFDIGEYYDSYYDDFNDIVKGLISDYVKVDYDIKTKKNKEIIEYELSGKGLTLLKFYNANSFNDVPSYEELKINDEDKGYICKIVED